MTDIPNDYPLTGKTLTEVKHLLQVEIARRKAALATIDRLRALLAQSRSDVKTIRGMIDEHEAMRRERGVATEP